MSGASDPESATGSKQAEAARQQGNKFAEAADALRQRADTSTKALGAIATTLLTALGVVKFADVFPLSNEPIAILIAASVGLGFVLMAIAVAAFIARSSRISQPVFTSSDIDLMPGLTSSERDLVAAVYGDMARLNGAPSLLAYEARAIQLERYAETLTEKAKQDESLNKAEVIRAEVRATQNRAAAVVIRKRTAGAVIGVRPWLIVALFLGGLILAGVGSDWLEDQRTTTISVIKSCAEADKALDDAELSGSLPPLCSSNGVAQGGKQNVAKPDIPSGDQEAAARVAFLSGRYGDCVSASAKNGGAGAEVCRRILNEINVASGAATSVASSP